MDDATATVAVYLIISAMRQFAKAEIACRNLDWKKNLALARDPEKKTIGIVGMGGIGTVVARRMALGWGMRVLYHNRSKLSHEPTDFSVEYRSSLEDLLAEADIVSLHIPVSQGQDRSSLMIDVRQDQELFWQDSIRCDEARERFGQYCTVSPLIPVEMPLKTQRGLN